MPTTPLVLYARRSSHMSRVVLLFATELGLAYTLQPVLNLLSQRSEDFGGNPALKVPTLQHQGESYFGALNCCRQLWKLAQPQPAVLWPEQMTTPLLQNAFETIQNGMSSEVALILHEPKERALHSSNDGLAKTRAGLVGGLHWLEQRLPAILTSLSSTPTKLDFVTIQLFCYLEHLEWRGVQSLADFPGLQSFRGTYGQRAAARATTYQFDSPCTATSR